MIRKCPICKKPTDSTSDPDFPFCSERCRLLDLGAWSSEKYVVSEPIFTEDVDEMPESELGSGKHPGKTDETIH